MGCRVLLPWWLLTTFRIGQDPLLNGGASWVGTVFTRVDGASP